MTTGRNLTKPAPDLFSAPRRFDLFTVLVAAAAYALLFTGMRLLNFPVGAMAFIGGLFTAIAIGQALGEGRISPRQSSVLAAILFWIVVAIANVVLRWNDGFGRGEPVAGIVFAVLAGIAWGLFSGYLVGVLVAGVFLVSFHLREAFAKRLERVDADADHDASPWDESADAAPANRKAVQSAENQRIDESS